MTITDVVDDLKQRGIELRLHEGKLQYRPRKIPQDVVKRITAHKPALIAYALPGWPENVTRPSWWLELAAGFPIGTFTQARPQVCQDRSCGFGVAVEWRDSEDGLLRWSCPKCGLGSADPDLLPNIRENDWAFEGWQS